MEGNLKKQDYKKTVYNKFKQQGDSKMKTRRRYERHF